MNVRKIMLSLLIFFLLFSNVTFVSAQIETPDKLDCPPEFVGQKKCFYVENGKFKEVEKTEVVKKRKVPDWKPKNKPYIPNSNGLPSYWGILWSGVSSLILMTDVGTSIHDAGVDAINHFDQWAYEEMIEKSDLFAQGFSYVTNDLIEEIEGNFVKYDVELPDLLVYPSLARYFPYENSSLLSVQQSYVFNRFGEDERFSLNRQGPLFALTPNTLVKAIVYINNSNGSYWFTDPKYSLNNNYYTHTSGSFNQTAEDVMLRIRSYGDTYKDEFLSNYADKFGVTFNDYNKILNNNDEINLEKLTEKPDFFPDDEVPNPDSMGIVEIDGKLYYEIDFENPYFDSEKEENKNDNPKKFTYFLEVENPSANPEPELLPVDDSNVYPNPNLDPSPDPNPDPSPDPNPDPSPDPNPDPSPRPDPQPTPTPDPNLPLNPEGNNQCEVINNEKWIRNLDQFNDKFPFSIPFDVYNAFNALFVNMGSEKPVFELPEFLGSAEITIPDFIDSLVKIYKPVLVIIFDLGLIYALYRWFGGAS